MKLSLKKEKYIETIYSLSEKDPHGHAHAKAIAENMGISMPSVSDALKNLSDLKLIDYQVRKAITLTDLGNKIAIDLLKKEKILLNFLVDILGLSSKEAEETACKMEHIIDSAFTDRLSLFIKFANDKKILENNNSIQEEFKKWLKK